MHLAAIWHEFGVVTPTRRACPFRSDTSAASDVPTFHVLWRHPLMAGVGLLEIPGTAAGLPGGSIAGVRWFNLYQ